MKKFKDSKGFTLIELLVVIAIIGILGAIVYAPFQTARRKGRDAQKIVEMKNIQAGLFLYADSHDGQYPTSLAVLEAAQTDKLPRNANKSSTYDPNKYNYTAYTQVLNGATSTLGFHLFTHLETASPVLSGTAACRGQGADIQSDPDLCLVAPGTLSIGAGSVDDDLPEVKFTKTERATTAGGVGDNDNTCATNQNYCIYDLKS